MTFLRKLKLVIEYDGTDYVGFQRQAKGKTIQGNLEKALSQLCGEKITIIGAGRTDSGVHALGQVCHFKTNTRFPIHNLAKAVNACLPRDIVVREAREMTDEFNARHSAISRTYAYFILNRPMPSAFCRRFTHWISLDLDVAAMNKACRYLLGKHDFSSFLKKGSSRKDPRITVREARCFRGIGRLRLPFPIQSHELITFFIKADSFLYTMVRTIMGTLLEIGKGKKDPEDMKKILHQRTRNAAGAAVSPKGLFLIKVDYPKRFQ